MKRRTRLRWKRKWKRVRRSTRKRVRNPVWALAGTALVAALVWSGVLIHRGRPDLLLQRARIALAHTQPELALELIDSLLSVKPDDMIAIKIRALAQLQAMLLDEARITLDRLIEQRPDLVDGHRLLMRWALLAMDRVLEESDGRLQVMTDGRFDTSMAEALAQATWLASHGDIAGESDLIRARCSSLDARRLRLALQAPADVESDENARLGVANAAPDMLPPPTEILRLAIESRQDQLEDRLRLAIRANPRYHDAWTMYVRVLVERKAWDILWDAIHGLETQTGLPAKVAATATAAVFAVPDSVQPREKKIEAGWRLQSVVAPRERHTVLWQRTTAELHLIAAEPEQALPLLEEALHAGPRDQRTRYLLAKCLYQLARYPQALLVIDKLGAEMPTAGPVQSLCGLTMLEVGDAFAAERVLRHALRLDPDDSNARAGLLMLMAEQGRLAEAETDIREHYGRNETDGFAIGLLMQLEQSRGRRNAVRSLLRRVEEISPRRDEDLPVLVDGYTFLADPEKTERYALELLRRRPDSLAARVALSQAALMRNRYGEAKEQLVALQQEFPDSAKVRQHLGSLYLRQGRFDQATVQLQQVVSLEPNNAPARLLLVRGLAGLSRMTDALDQLEYVLEKDPKNAPAFKLLMRLVRSDAPGKRLTDDLRRLDDLGTFDLAGPVVLAELKLRVGKRDEAVTLCRDAIKAGDTDPFLRIVLARVHTENGMPDEAEAQLVALVHDHPRDPLGYQLIAQLYFDRDEPREGITALRQFERLNAPMARLAQSWLLGRSGKLEAAYQILRDDYPTLVSARHPLSLAFADAIASLHLNMGDSGSAEGVYHALIEADHFAGQAALREIDLKEKRQPASNTVSSLDALAGCLQSKDDRLRFEMMQRYARLGRRDRALALLDQWVEQRPDDVNLLRGKASLLVEMSRLTDALDALRQASSMAPDDVTLWRRLAQVLRMNVDYPGAEAVYERMIDMDESARVVALADLSRMYLDLGLSDRASDTLKQLGALDRPLEPGVTLALARVLADLGEDDQAGRYLLTVPGTAPQYPAAQVLLVRLEQGAGATDKARARLNALLRDPQTRGATVAVALSAAAADRRAGQMLEQMLQWIDTRIDPQDLPPALQQHWLSVRVKLASDRLDWHSVQSTLSHLAQLDGDSMRATAARVALLTFQGRQGEARRILQESSSLPTSAHGRLLALALDLPRHDDAPQPPMALVMEAVLRGDLESARAAAAGTHETMFPGDLLSWLEHLDAQLPEVRAGCRNVALAIVAHDCGLDRLAAEISLRVIDHLPGCLPAHGIHVQSMLTLGLPIDEAIDRLRRNARESSLAMFVDARQGVAAGDLVRAARSAEKLLEREPESMTVRLFLAELYEQSGRVEDAIRLLEELRTDPASTLASSGGALMGRRGSGEMAGPFHATNNFVHAQRLTVANNLAFLLAEHRPRRLTDAHRIGLEALQDLGHLSASRGAAGLLDTVGWIEHLRNDDRQALKYLGQAIVGGYCAPAVHEHLARVYQSLGNATWAQYHREAAAPQEAG